eukprot:m.170867 g.170867  ORF g.170867 m.170867 type:complete len:206 (+) comp53261_c0_seq19:148-765(+)
MRVYVGGLSGSVDRSEVQREFQRFGTLADVWVARNPPGFAFLEFEDDHDAQDACKEMDGRELFGGRLRVEVSRGGRGGGRGGRGSYGRGGSSRRSRSRSRSRYEMSQTFCTIFFLLCLLLCLCGHFARVSFFLPFLAVLVLHSNINSISGNVPCSTVLVSPCFPSSRLVSSRPSSRPVSSRPSSSIPRRRLHCSPEHAACAARAP